MEFKIKDYEEYRLTNHAFERYRERIKAHASDKEIIRNVRRFLKNAEYMPSGGKGDGLRFYEKDENVTLIVNTDDKTVISLYKEGVSDEGASVIDEDVKRVISEYAVTMKRKEERTQNEILGILYLEYGEKLLDLSKTTRLDYLDRSKKEKEVLENKIKEAELLKENKMQTYEIYI